MKQTKQLFFITFLLNVMIFSSCKKQDVTTIPSDSNIKSVSIEKNIATIQTNGGSKYTENVIIHSSKNYRSEIKSDGINDTTQIVSTTDMQLPMQLPTRGMDKKSIPDHGINDYIDDGSGNSITARITLYGNGFATVVLDTSVMYDGGYTIRATVLDIWTEGNIVHFSVNYQYSSNGSNTSQQVDYTVVM